jgi:ferredoxin--NADP+ reductase
MTHLTDYDVSQRHQAVLKRSERITPEQAPEVRNIVLNIQSPAFDYQPGQSVGVYIPGPHAFGNPYHLRLYSIANARANPAGGGVDIELCVRRCFYIDEVSGEQYPGLASNWLCDAQIEDRVTLTGPYGSHFRMPMDNRANLLMIGTGTGVAPFRAFIQQIYQRHKHWRGQVRLFYGAKTGMEQLYRNVKNNDLAHYYDEATFQAFEGVGERSWSGEETVIESSLRENAEDVWQWLQDDKTHVYLAGLEKLSLSLDKVMVDLAGSESRWKWLRQDLIEQKRWSELLYF